VGHIITYYNGASVEETVLIRSRITLTGLAR